MKNLMTRKHIFGVLMVFVLAFSITGTGIADPLKITPRSDTTQEKRPNDAPFELQFSVQLNGDTIAYNLANPRKRVTDNNDLTIALRIDSSGYKVTDIGTSEYRNAPTGANVSTLRPTTGTNREVVTLMNSAQPSYTDPEANQAITYNGTYLVDTSGNAVTTVNGFAIYIRTDAGAKAVPAVYEHTDGNADNDDDNDGTPNELITAAVPAKPFKYTRAKADPDLPVSVAERFDYNEEEIRVTVETTASPNDLQMSVKGSNYFLVSGTDLTEVSRVLTSSMALVCRVTTPGTYDITIEDATEPDDYPRGNGVVGQGFPLPINSPDAGLRRSKIEFTLRVTTEEEIATEGILAQRAGSQNAGVKYLRVDTGEAIEYVSADFRVTPTNNNLQIRYKVIRGSGTLYAAETSTTGIYRGPNQDLTVHQSADVFLNTNNTTNTVSASIAGADRQTHEATIEYEYTGSGGTTTPTPTRTPTPTPTPRPTAPSLTLVPSTLSGAPGASVPLTAVVNNQAANVLVTFSINGIPLSQVSTNSLGQASTSVLLPASNATVTASASGYSTATASISVTGAPTPTPTVSEPATIEIYDGDDQQGEINQRLDEDLVVQVLDRNNNGVSFELVRFRIVEGRGRISPSSTRTDRDGLADVTFTPRSQGTVEVEAYTGDLSPVIFTVNVGEPPDAIKKISGDDQSGRPGTALANPFVVEVVDENDDGVSGATVTFSVTAGGGSVSPGSATTNASGRAQTTLTLGDAIGDNTVTARVTGLTGVTFRAGAGAEVHVDASNRAPIYWIDKQNGTLHRLVDDEVENLASNVEGVTSLAVDEANGLIYWGVQVGRSGGKIQRSRLNGRNIQVLKDGLFSVPTSIALDGTGGTLYWTTSSGKIKSMATEGSTRVTNILQDLANPTALAVSNGHAYWAEPLGRIGRVSLTATRKIPANIATGLGEPVSLAIAKGKIYWLERNGSGLLQRANLNGQNIEELRSFVGSKPLGIAVDSSDNKIYWTKVGKIQRTGLTARTVRDVVTGLTRPGAIALGGTVPDDEPVVTETKQPKKTTTTTKTATPTDNSKYDVNGDGTVDLLDVFAPIFQPNNMKNDVNGDGVVDAKDAQEIDANRDDAAAAPAIDVDVKALDIDFDRVQEQIEALLASGDMSLGTQRALMYLQHLLASARPDATVLLASYPNPFNPETWIPYHLATSTDVKINIYNAQGILVRALTLGHQSAGYYTSRSRSAYWDGRNALGERVASGIYFYQLQADEISPLRKMVILK